MTIRSRRSLAILWMIAAFMLAGGCGRKTPPATPDSPRPEPVQNLKAVARDTAVFLSWPVPTKNVEGKDMGASWIGGFLVYRAEVERDRKRPRYRLIAELSMPGTVTGETSPLPSVEVRNGVALWTDRGLKYGRVYAYRIRAVSVKGGESVLSQEARVAPLLSLATPNNVTAAAGDSRIQLSWDAVTTRTDGSRYEGFVGYNIYRGTATGRHDETPLNKEPVRTNAYTDTAAANDRTYFYVVRSVDSPVLPWKESLDSSEVSATPRDLTPPERPAGVTVVPGMGRVFLTWNENKERDLAGYYVYRSAKSGKDYVRLTDKPLSRSTFSDETVTAGKVYYYVITAVDQAGNESARSKEYKAYAEKLR